MRIVDIEKYVGISSEPVLNEVEKGAIRKFADAIGDSNPMYREPIHPCGRIIAPPTFSRTFDYGKIPGFQLPPDGLIHGSQVFEYTAPICAGDVLHCTSTLRDVKQKSGKLGTMIFIVFENQACREDGTPVVTETLTVIYRGESA